MVKVIRRFFDFCGAANRKKFVASIWLGVLLALFEALKIPAIAVMMRAMLPVELGGNGGITTRDILLSLGIMLLSILGSGLAKAKATMLQTEAGYDTCAMKRIEIAEHMRYLPMGYFNENSLGQITSVCRPPQGKWRAGRSPPTRSWWRRCWSTSRAWPRSRPTT